MRINTFPQLLRAQPGDRMDIVVLHYMKKRYHSFVYRLYYYKRPNKLSGWRSLDEGEFPNTAITPIDDMINAIIKGSFKIVQVDYKY